MTPTLPPAGPPLNLSGAVRVAGNYLHIFKSLLIKLKRLKESPDHVCYHTYVYCPTEAVDIIKDLKVHPVEKENKPFK